MFRQKISNRKNNKKGFALTEVLLSILVITFIGIGAYVLYSKSREQLIVTEQMNVLTNIVWLTEQSKGQRPTYDSVNLFMSLFQQAFPDKDFEIKYSDMDWNVTGNYTSPEFDLSIYMLFPSESYCVAYIQGLAGIFQDMGDQGISSNNLMLSNGKLDLTQVAKTCSRTGVVQLDFSAI